MPSSLGTSALAKSASISRISTSFSADIDSFGYDDCAAHPTWFEPSEWLGGPRASEFPLHLLANQPASRLHSQLDGGAASQASKVTGREPIRMNPSDARERGLAAVGRLFF